MDDEFLRAVRQLRESVTSVSTPTAQQVEETRQLALAIQRFVFSSYPEANETERASMVDVVRWIASIDGEVRAYFERNNQP